VKRAHPSSTTGSLRQCIVQVAVVLIALAATELTLRATDPRYLREGARQGYSLVYRYNAELGWSPAPNSSAQFTGSRTISVRHNSLGLRDIEHDGAVKPTVMFVGDSFVWGYDVEANERFTEVLRPRLPQARLVNAGVSGYGTDQEYLLMRRLWDRIRPNVVVLMFCVNNDRADNTLNALNDGYYKPYLAQAADGAWQFRGQPVPRSRHVYFINDWLPHNLWLARLAVSAYVRFLHPEVSVPDPTEHLVGMMRAFVEGHGASFVVGIQRHEPQLEAYLQAQEIPYTTFDDAESYKEDGAHWTPKGHALVADRLTELLAGVGIAPAGRPAKLVTR
jgi:lysophospholipase L1-like esterase